MKNPPDATRPTILFVEDENEIRDVVTRELEEAGFDVLQAETGEKAMDLMHIHDGDIDWLFTDIRLAGPIDGWHVAFEYHYHHPHRPVVYATGYTPDTSKRLGNSILLRKPYRVAQVIEAFRQLVASQAGAGRSPSP